MPTAADKADTDVILTVLPFDGRSSVTESGNLLQARRVTAGVGASNAHKGVAGFQEYDLELHPDVCRQATKQDHGHQWFYFR